MGERSPDYVAPPSRTPWSRSTWGLVGVLLLAVLAAAWPRSAYDPTETAAVLLAHSVLTDGDRALFYTDRGRLEQWQRASPTAELPTPVVEEVDGNDLLVGSWIYGWYLAPWVAVLGPLGARLGHALFLALAILLVSRALQPRLLDDAATSVLCLVFASGFGLALLHLWEEAFAGGLVAIALTLALKGAPAPAEGLTEIYAGEEGEGVSFRLRRWLGVGVLLGLAALVRLEVLALLVAVIWLLPSGRRALGTAWVLIGTAAVLGLGYWLGGLTIPTGLFDSTSRHLGLWGANLVQGLGGRQFGILPYFAPLLLLVSGAASGARGRLGLAVGVGLGFLVSLWLAPFTHANGPFAVGSRGFLALYPALWLMVDRAPRRWTVAACWALGLAVLWPAWLQASQPPADAQWRPTRVAPYVARWLPAHTTQAPGAVPTLHLEGIEIRLLSPGLRSRRAGEIETFGAARVDLVLVSSTPVEGLRLEVEEGAGAEVELAGAELRQSVFRPDGSLGFLVSLDPPRTVHPLRRGGPPQYFRPLSVTLPGAGPRPHVLRLGGVETTMRADG